MNNEKQDTTTMGSMRHQMELRQITGLMMALGLAAVFQPLAGVTSAISPDGGTVTTGIPFSNLFGGLCVISIGFLSVFIGFSKLVFNWHNKALVLFSLFWVQTSWIPYITGMTGVGRTARSGMGFIPAAYNPTESDVRFVGACGILAIIAYGFSFIGSISYTQFAFHAHLSGKAEQRSGNYYRKRGRLYSYLFFQAGLAQLLLGSYVLSKFGGGDLENGPVTVAMLFVSFPGIAVFLGLIQVLLGLWGVARSFQIGVFFERDFATAMFAAWVLQVILHVLVQVGYVPGGGAVGAAPTITGFSVGLNLMPAYLDFKGRSLPAEISPEYYGETDSEVGSDANSISEIKNTVVVTEKAETAEDPEYSV